jgi:hypothetical protein
MARATIYISDADAPLFKKLKKLLAKENRNMSEFVTEAARNYANRATAEPGDIELEGPEGKKIFKGHTLYWSDDRYQQLGVFLTAKGAIAFWNFVPESSDPDPEWELYDDIDDFFAEQDWIEEDRNRHMKAEIQREYVALTNKPFVERLDI